MLCVMWKRLRIDKPANAKVTCSCEDEEGCKWENSRAAVREHLFDGIGGKEEILEGGLLKMNCFKQNEDECPLPGEFLLKNY